MTDERLSRLLMDVLDDMAPRRMPDYLDEVLDRTARTRQRPAWTFPERWFPMVAIARPVFMQGRSPLLILIIVAALLGAVAVAVIGSRPRQLPPPTGPAGNGLIAYESGGDIYVADLATGQTRRLLSGPERDFRPTWSYDGTRIAFLRAVAGGWAYFTMRADGSGITQVTPDGTQIVPIYPIFWSPDGTSLLFETGSVVYVAQTDGSVVRQLNPSDLPADLAAWKPDGTQVLFRGGFEGSYGLYVINRDGSGLRMIRGGLGGASEYAGAWSADGTRIAYLESSPATGDLSLHVILADGSDDRVIGDTSALEAANLEWSPDGKRLLYVAPEGSPATLRVWVVTADGSGSPVAVGPTFGSLRTALWSPDGRSILVADGATSWYLLDQQGGETGSVLPWTGAIEPGAWQRVAP